MEYSYTSSRSATRSRGFTLVELLVVIAIIGVLVGLLLPAVQAAREAARRSQCINNLHNMALAVQTYESSKGHFPESYGGFGRNTQQGEIPAEDNNLETGVGWQLMLLPQLEQQSLFDQFDSLGALEGFFNAPSSSGLGLQRQAVLDAGLLQTQLPTYMCPSDASVQQLSTEQFQWAGKTVATTSYKGNSGNPCPPGIFDCTERTYEGTTTRYVPPGMPSLGVLSYADYRQPTEVRMIEDGLSNTLLIGEDIPEHNDHSTVFYANSNSSITSTQLNYLPQPPTPRDWRIVQSFRSYHPGGANFAKCDASVTFIPESIDIDVYWWLSTRDGHEVLNSTSF
ncbi:MAG: DUF1559 domain-containing protein [Lacipirellulaceae bacterium]